MAEPTSVICGRRVANGIRSFINLLPKNQRGIYKSRLIDELNQPFSFGALEDIHSFNITKNPEHYAKSIKTLVYLGRREDISKMMMDSLLKTLSNL